MADKGIIFSAAMVRALLAGTKTQTRRLIKPCPWPEDLEPPYIAPYPEGTRAVWCDSYDGSVRQAAPYVVGDRLYVRENWRVSPEACEGWHPEQMRGWIDYAAGGSLEAVAPSIDAIERAAFLKGEDRDWDFLPSRWRPCIHMPRWASRITLTVIDVRVQRLQEISEGDAIAEGIPGDGNGRFIAPGTAEDENGLAHTLASSAYMNLWNSLHTEPGTTWADNPWIVAVSFDAGLHNIDRSPA